MLYLIVSWSIYVFLVDILQFISSDDDVGTIQTTDADKERYI